MKRPCRALAVIAAIAALAAWGMATGHLLVFLSPPIQVCVGWPDDSRPSYACTPDYTAR